MSESEADHACNCSMRATARLLRDDGAVIAERHFDLADSLWFGGEELIFGLSKIEILLAETVIHPGACHLPKTLKLEILGDFPSIEKEGPLGLMLDHRYDPSLNGVSLIKLIPKYGAP